MATTKTRTVVIDPGHGGTARAGGSSPNNAVAPNGLLEKDVALDIARRVATALAERANVILTRTADENRPLGERARVARDANADVFLSIHLNGWRDAAIDGSEAWVARDAGPASRALARNVLDRVVAVTQAGDRGVREENLGVLVSNRHAPTTAASLVELAFLSNPNEAARLARDDYRQAIAQAIAEGIEAATARPAAAAALTTAGPARIDGIDCFQSEGIVGYDALRADGIEFVILKATEHATFKDSAYADRHFRARAAGFPVGAYHFYRANADSGRQATNFIDVVGRLLPGDLPPSFDFEGGGDGPDGLKASGIKGAGWLEPLTSFLDPVEKALGRSPMIYTSQVVWQEFVKDDSALAWFGDYPLWVKHWHLPKATRYANRMARQPNLPAPWSDWTIWQYSGDFTPAEYTNLIEVNKRVDANVSNGGIAVLRGLADLGRPAPHGNTPRFVAYTESDGTIKLLTFLGYWLESNLTDETGRRAAGDVAACVIGDREYIAFRDEGTSHLFELERNLTEGTSSLVDISVTRITGTQSGRTPAVPAADPVYLVDGADRFLGYWGEDNHQYLLKYDASGDVWRPTDITEAGGLDDASGSPVCFVSGGTAHLVARAGRDGELVDVSLNGNGAQRRNRIAESGAPAATYQPSAYTGADGQNYVVFRALRGEIYQVDERSTPRNLSRDAGGARTCAGKPAAFVFNGLPHVVYRGTDGILFELAGDGSGGFTYSSLPCPAAAADPAASVGTDGAFVVYLDRDGTLREAALTSAGWSCTPIEPVQNVAPAQSLDAPPTPVVSVADSPEVDQVVAAHHCGVAKKGGSYSEHVPAGVVIHVLQAVYADVIASWSAGRSCKPPHYVIRKDGEITQLVAEKFVAQHAKGGNTTNIGIEHDGWDGDPASFTDEMYLASAALVRDICSRNAIPVDLAHVVGHDQVGGHHGDPGGYWDWDYYLALLQWDGSTEGTKPLRAVVDTTGFAVPGGWNEEDRDSGNAAWRTTRQREGPYPRSSYGERYLWADGAADADPSDAVAFQFTVPAGGEWAVSGWWPVLPSANRATHIEFTTTSSDPTQQTASSVIDQRSDSYRSRPTLALPHSPVWSPLPVFQLQQNDVITARIQRRTDQAGRVFADAFRFLKR